MGRRRKTHKHLPQRVYLRSGTYYFVDYTGKWHNLGRNYAAAMAEYGQLSDDNRPCQTLADVIDRYVREVAPMKAPRTYQDNLRQSKYLRAALGRLDPRRITQQTIYAYMDARGKRGRVQANRELALLSNIFKKAIRWGVVSSNPCSNVERFSEKPRQRYVEDSEYAAFRSFAGPLIAAYMDFKLLTGLRRGDILAIRLDQLKEDGIHIHISKTGKPIIIEWIDALESAVSAARRLPRPVTGLFLFSTRKGQPYTSSGFSSIWQRKMRAAVNKGILRERFTDHDLRAKSASDTDVDHATRLLAHLDRKTTHRHYRRKPEKVKPLK